MRKILWKISVFIIAIFLLRSFALAQGLNGYLDINRNTTKQYDDGEMTSSSDLLNRTLYLNVQEPITPVLSYQFNIRTNFRDSKTLDSMNETSNSYSRSIEPGLDLSLGSLMYNWSTGLRRREQWRQAHLNNDNRKTNEYYYSRLSLSPDLLPSLSIQLDRQKNYDYLNPKAVDDSSTVYTLNSSYDLPPGDLRFRYTINYLYNINKTPLSLANKTIGDNFNSTYNIGYSGRVWQDKVDYSTNYQGDFSRFKIKQFVAQTGTVLNKRISFAGLYVFDVPPLDPATGQLSTQNELINNDLNSGITSINIGPIVPATTHTNHNIGIWVSPENSVDRLYIYVDRDINGDTNLGNVNNWKIYKSNSNTAVTTWTEITASQVTIVTDTINNIFRYEIRFLTEQNASYFKAVNLATVNSSNIGPTDPVYVTEIEALGTDIADQRTLVNVSNSFTQQLSMNTNIRPTSNLSFALNYAIDRSDQNMVSMINSVSGIFKNIFSDSFSDEKTNFISKITRGYSVFATWLTHRFLTTKFGVQQNESFDNIKETDVKSNSYNLSFLSEPLATLNANLSLIRSYSYSFSQKVSTSDSLLLSVDSRLYRDLNMITDMIYTKSHSFASETTSSTDTTSSTKQINGMLDALITRNVSGTLTYHLSWTESDGTPSESKEGAAFISYRTGKLLNITGNFRISDSDGETSTAEGLLLDWLPLPAIRLNANYQHSDTAPGPNKADTLTSYVIWYVTKFMDVRLINSYSKQVDDKETENYSMSTSLNCRF